MQPRRCSEAASVGRPATRADPSPRQLQSINMARGKGVDLAAKDRQERLNRKCKKEVKKWKWTGQLDVEDFKKGGCIVTGLRQEVGEEGSRRERQAGVREEEGEEGSRKEALEEGGMKEVLEGAESLQVHLVELSLEEGGAGRLRDCATEDEESDEEEEGQTPKENEEDVTNEDAEAASLVERCAGFRGCDSCCEVEDLTPYQGTRRCLGEYHCPCGLRSGEPGSLSF